MKRLVALAMLLPLLSNAAVRLDKGWRFTREAGDSALMAQYDDTAWRSVVLPHDWSVELDFDYSAPAGNDGGYVTTGVGYYRLPLDIAPEEGKTYTLYFEGVYQNSEVWVNGNLAGGHPYGYTSFRVDVTPYIVAGENIVAVKVDNSQQKNSRWFTGSGIYRPVWLEERPAVHIRPGSLYLNPVKYDGKSATVEASFELIGNSTAEVECRLELDGVPHVSPARRDTSGRYLATFNIESPRLWDPVSPYLYNVRFAVDDAVEETRLGIRFIDFSTDGFTINGRPILLNGACVHHDNGILGAVSVPEAEYLKVKTMRDAGFNALRTSHNPPSPAFLDACDELGILVIDEAFDDWREAKTEHSYARIFDRWAEADLTAMVERDRQHPSIIAWSIGNEILERKSPEAVELASRLADVCRRLDPARPVTQALAAWDSDWEIYDPLAAAHDIVGYNYMIHKHEGDHERVPERIMWQTESYPRDAYSNWLTCRDNDYIVGDFVWTGLDYTGESGIGRHYYDGDPEGEHWERPLWPWHGSQCGDVDLMYQRKPISYYRQMLWAMSDTAPGMLSLAVREPDGYRGHVRETLWGTWPTYRKWNWPGHEGKPISIEVASTWSRVLLYLNDALVGESATNPDNHYIATFEIPYTPGTIRAVALNAAGAVAEELSLSTPGDVTGYRMTTLMPDKGRQFVLVEAVDTSGNLVDHADCMLNFAVESPGRVMASGNADPKDPDAYSSPRCRLYNGRAGAWIDLGGSPGVTLTVTDGVLTEKIDLINQ